MVYGLLARENKSLFQILAGHGNKLYRCVLVTYALS